MPINIEAKAFDISIDLKFPTNNQENMRDYLQEAFGNMSPFSTFEEMSRQNMAFFESAMQMFTPAKPGNGQSPANANGSNAQQASRAESSESDDIAALRSQLADMQRRLDSLSDD